MRSRSASNHSMLALPVALLSALPVALLSAVAGGSILAAAQEPQDAQRPPPQGVTVSMETTFRPDLSATADAVGYSPLPLTPDLGGIASSLATQPSASDAMRKAGGSWRESATRDEL
ncbi:hypothetical protein GQ54DRAFT_154488 [Martensiomyces pterosporus]|nr:hypothetical protein GQ54DRAFT_154488 [Martensiomyces pterosporus]